MRSLFDPREPIGMPQSKVMPYSLSLDLYRDNERTSFPPDEVDIFHDVASHETPLYEPRGLLAGPIVLQIAGGPVCDLGKTGRSLKLPKWVEADGLDFKKCRAAGILLVENISVFECLRTLPTIHSARLLLVTGAGLPRSEVRRVLHRIVQQFDIPLYVISDNDTWGYFLFSMVKRGTLAPAHQCPQLAVKRANYLGLLADDSADTLLNPELATCLRPWKDCWDVRLKFLRSYACFQSPAWKSELKRFKLNRKAVTLARLQSNIGAERFAEEFILERIASGRFLA